GQSYQTMRRHFIDLFTEHQVDVLGEVTENSCWRVTRVCDATSEDLRVQQCEPGELDALREQSPSPALHHGVNEQPVLVGQACLDEGMAQRDTAGDDDVPARLL